MDSDLKYALGAIAIGLGFTGLVLTGIEPMLVLFLGIIVGGGFLWRWNITPPKAPKLPDKLPDDTNSTS